MGDMLDRLMREAQRVDGGFDKPEEPGKEGRLTTGQVLATVKALNKAVENLISEVSQLPDTSAQLMKGRLDQIMAQAESVRKNAERLQGANR